MVFTSAARSVTSRGPARADPALEVAVGHLAGLGGEPVQRPDRGRPQAEGEHHHGGRRPTATAMNTASSTVAESFRSATAWARAPRVGLEHGHLGPQRVEVRLAGQGVGAGRRLSGLADPG